MALTPISAISMSGTSLGGLREIDGFGSTGASATSGSDSGGGFAASLTKALDNLAASQATADQLALQAATGDLQAVHDYTIAATEAQLLTQLTVEVRNRAIEAFNDIMRMQV